jgi:dTDP-4-amino-4,6-dideoxygalactose transaminase
MEFDTFAIGFDHRDRGRLYELWEQVLDTNMWSDGPLVSRFEETWAAWNGLPAVATHSWTGAALAALEFFELRGKTVLCPSNTFMASPLAIQAVGARVEFVDCNRSDLCLSLADLERKVAEHKPAAVMLVHIGGHIAFEAEQIADFCASEGLVLIEDCAHAHGAHWNGRKAGTYGDVGLWSFAPTKTISTGEGGLLVSRHQELIDYARAYRNYGKPTYAQPGLNYRMNEFTAALGVLGAERLEEIVAWKNTVAREELDPVYPNRVILPEGMISGYYKYVVFEPIARSTGKVYDEPCHRVMGHQVDLPNTDWVAGNHWCVPLYYRPAVVPDPLEAVSG